MIKGTKKPVNIPGPILNASIHNRFDIELVDAASGVVRQKAYAENVILNQLWTAHFWNTAWFKYIHYGTGTSTPSPFDTQLEQFFAAVSAGSLTWGYTADTVWARKQIQLLETVAVGQTIAEVGIGRTNAANTLCTRALLRDMNGNIITIAKTDRDILNIYATVYFHFDVGGYDNGHIHVLPGYLNEQANTDDLISCVLGLAKGASFNSRFGGECNTYGATVSTTFSWDGENKTLTGILARLPAASGNTRAYGGINTLNGELAFNVGGAWFPGSEIIGEPIGTGDGTTKDFSTVFGAIQQGAKVYVDGVQQIAGVTIDHDLTKSGLQYIRQSDGVRKNAKCAYGDFYRKHDTFDGQTGYLQNPYYPATGLYSVTIYESTAYGGKFSIFGSDDLENWTQVVSNVSVGGQSTSTAIIPESGRGYKYYAINGNGGTVYNAYFHIYECEFEHNTSGDIHFDTPPADGTVITADYVSKSIAKDEYHVFDLTFTISFGERT